MLEKIPICSYNPISDVIELDKKNPICSKIIQKLSSDPQDLGALWDFPRQKFIGGKPQAIKSL